MKKRIRYQLLSGILSLCLAGSQMVIPSLTVYADQPAVICPHHVHDEDCGYSEGTHCNHEHDEECYREVTRCIHEHNEDCYSDDYEYDEEASPSDAKRTPSNAEDYLNCPHICDEDSDCITKALDCKHEHDEACGYVPATEGTPCTYVCKICNAQDSGNPAAPSDAQPEECTCATLCIEEEINVDCPVCSAEGVKLDEVCTGEALVPVRSGSAHTHPVCGSSESCTEPDHGTEHTDVTWIEWNETTFLPDSGGNYYLTGDVTLSETWKAPSKETSLCLNGYSITYENSSDQGSVIKVPSGVTLTITDCAKRQVRLSVVREQKHIIIHQFSAEDILAVAFMLKAH